MRSVCVAMVALLLACGGEGGATSEGTGGATTGTGGGTGGSGTGGSGEPMTLAFLDDHNIPTGSMLDGVEMGGLSGLWIDPASGQSWAICDDQNQYGPPRFYALGVALTASELSVSPTSFTPFDTGTTPANEMDAEGIARTSSGELYVSTEGDTTPVVAPALLHLGGDGSLIAELAVDAKFVPDGTSGVRRNQGFEALTLSPDGSTLFTATEGALAQDGPVASFDEGHRCRIVRYDVASGSPTAEHFYLTDPVPPAAPGALGEASIGLPELLALSNDRLLALERASVQVDGVYTNTIRVYEVHLEGAANIRDSDPMPSDAVPVDKRLVLDLDDILPELDPSHPTLDNVEAMSFGPTLPDGRATIVLMSDNNFGPTQRTAFFAFAIE